MLRNNKLLATTLLIVGCVLIVAQASPALSQCVSGTMTAEFQTSGEFAGLWKYTVAITWDIPQSPSHFTLDCGFGLCPELACAQAWVFDEPAGVATGEDSGASCEADYNGLFDCDGDPSVGLADPVIKWEPVDTTVCKTDTGGSGTFSFYVNLGPHAESETPIMLIKNGQNLCQGVVVGDCPGVCPGGEPTIQAGVNAVEDGAILEVTAGTYTGEANKNINFGGKEITLISEAGPDATIIDCEGSGRAFFFNGGEPSTAIVQGFTVKNGDPTLPGGAIHIGPQGSNVMIKNVRVCENTSTHTAVVAIEAGSPCFENVLFDLNKTEGLASVIWAKGDPLFVDCMIKDNESGNTAVVVESGSPKFEGTTITNNIAPRQAVLVGSSATFDGCIITQNTSDGLRLLSGAAPALLVNSEISSNKGAGVIVMENSSHLGSLTISSNKDGGIIHGTRPHCPKGGCLPQGAAGASTLDMLPLPLLPVSTPSQPTITDVVISGNISTTSSGGGIKFSCDDTPELPYMPTYLNCTITGNSSFFDGGGVNVCGNAIDADISPIFIGCTIASNSAGGVGGGVNAEVNVGGAQSLIDLDESIVWGNCAAADGNEAFAVSSNVVQLDCSDIDIQGVAGPGDINIGPDVIFSDPEFCAPASCDESGTIYGVFDLDETSGASQANSPCGKLMGAQPEICTPTAIGDQPGRPSRTELLRTTPNPFNPSATIRFNLAETAHVTLRIYDALGRQVRTLVDRQMPGAEHSFVWQGTDDRGEAVATGVYFLRFSAGDVVETSKLVLLK